MLLQELDTATLTWSDHPETIHDRMTQIRFSDDQPTLRIKLSQVKSEFGVVTTPPMSPNAPPVHNLEISCPTNTSVRAAAQAFDAFVLQSAVDHAPTWFNGKEYGQDACAALFRPWVRRDVLRIRLPSSDGETLDCSVSGFAPRQLTELAPRNSIVTVEMECQGVWITPHHSFGVTWVAQDIIVESLPPALPHD